MQKLVCSLTLFAAAAAASGNDAIPLWPNGAPGENAPPGEERDATTAKDGLVSGKRVIRLGNVGKPSLTLFRPPKDLDTGAAVVVFPGGGYNILAWDLEGTEVCDWLNSIGLTAVLVKYRVPARPGGPRYAAPLQDAQRAVRMVRYRAIEWGLDPTRLGVMGFSAGGHLAAAVSTNFDALTYEAVDDADRISCRPDFAMLIYPAYLTLKEEGNKISPELKITSHVPPTFLLQAEDDGIRVENSIFYYYALKQANVPAEMHLYAAGGHGYGLRPSSKSVSRWPLLAEQWLRSLGVLHARTTR